MHNPYWRRLVLRWTRRFYAGVSWLMFLLLLYWLYTQFFPAAGADSATGLALHVEVGPEPSGIMASVPSGTAVATEPSL